MTKKSDLHELVKVLLSISKVIQKQSKESWEETVASRLQFQALDFIYQEHLSKASEIAEALSLSASSTTQLLERLENQGLVERQQDMSDRRLVRIAITNEGIKQHKNIEQKISKKYQTIFGTLSDSEIKELTKINRTLLENLQNKK